MLKQKTNNSIPEKGIEKMKTPTIEEMILAGATKEEAENAYKLFELLRPGLKIKKNGRIDTNAGDKTPLGLYRTIGRFIFS
jgi:hypothetical protein